MISRVSKFNIDPKTQGLTKNTLDLLSEFTMYWAAALRAWSLRNQPGLQNGSTSYTKNFPWNFSCLNSCNCGLECFLANAAFKPAILSSSAFLTTSELVSTRTVEFGCLLGFVLIPDCCTIKEDAGTDFNFWSGFMLETVFTTSTSGEETGVDSFLIVVDDFV